jgi:crotonobetaine/carnitine-CoA ligase
VATRKTAILPARSVSAHPSASSNWWCGDEKPRLRGRADHPEEVLDVAAYPVTSDRSKDEVMVTIVLREGEMLSPGGSGCILRAQHAVFHGAPLRRVRGSLPKTMTGKAEKYKLRAAAEHRLDELWDREKAGIVVAR